MKKNRSSNSGPEQNTSAKHQILDPKRIKQINDIGDASLLSELLTMYLEDLKQYSIAIIMAQRVNNFPQIYESSHKLKGSSANIGIESIRQACEQMELYATECDPVRIEAQFTAMQEMFEQIRQHIVTNYPVQ